jgi:uncharacterized delta-60 repeat protein
MTSFISAGNARRICATVGAFFLFAWAGMAAAQPGSVDASYGSGGSYVSGVALGDSVRALALQSDNKAILAGNCNSVSPATSFCVTRLTASGTVDTSFNGTGKAFVTMGSLNSTLESVVIQPDGKIVVAGNCTVSSAPRWCVARIMPDGTMDASFGAGGKAYFAVFTGAGQSSSAAAVAVQSGKLLVAGTCTSSATDASVCAIRVNADGTQDVPWTSGGLASSGKPFHVLTARRIVVLNDGRFLIASNDVDTFNLSPSRFNLTRFLANGTVDSAYGNSQFHPGHLVPTMSNGSNTVFSVALQPDDKVVMAGRCESTANDGDFKFCMARATQNGDPLNNIPWVDFALVLSAHNSLLPNKPVHVALQGDGRIVLAGTCREFPEFSMTLAETVCVRRYWPTGAFDDSLAEAPNPAATLAATADGGVVIQSDGKILVAGATVSPTDKTAMRFLGGPLSYRACSLDMDGDGLTTATIDGLISTRVMLGLTGTAVTNGITFPAAATRTNWTAIRNFLVTHCGMNLP